MPRPKPKASRKSRKPGWQLRAHFCELMLAHYGDATDIARNVQGIIQFIETNTIAAKSGKPNLALVKSAEAGND